MSKFQTVGGWTNDVSVCCLTASLAFRDMPMDLMSQTEDRLCDYVLSRVLSDEAGRLLFRRLPSYWMVD